MDEFKQRFSAAKAQRNLIIDTFGREVYKFCFNGREYEWDSSVKSTYEPEEIFTDVQATIAEDFTGELMSTMMPENTPWVSYETGSVVPENKVQEAKQDLEQIETAIERSIKASNFYSEGHSAFQDAVIGNVAMWIDRPRLNGPAICESISAPEMYLRLGPFGIADRFRVKTYFTRDLPALFPNAEWPKKLKDKIEKSKNSRSKVVWGFWPTYEDPENPVWQKQIRVDDEAIGLDEALKEEGEMEFVVGRFNAVPGTPWGRGPGLRMLPTIRVLDAISQMTLEGMDRNLDPAFTYPHDGVLDLSDGIESGLGYPAMPGSGDSIQPIGVVDNLDYGFFSQEQIEERIRNGFYRETMQRGKTPPSATQYMSQETKQLARIARPAASLWREFGVGVLRRFEYLERQSGGLLEGVKLPLIDSGLVAPRPISPLERTQARDDVLMGQSLLEMTMNSVGPEQAGVYIDMPRTMRNVKDRMNDRLVEFRSQEEVQQHMQQMQAMMQQGGQGEQ